MYYNIIQEEQLDAGERERRCKSGGGGSVEKTTVGRNLLIFFKSLRSSARPRESAVAATAKFNKNIFIFHDEILLYARASS